MAKYQDALSGASISAEVNEGLRAYLSKVYGIMAGGLALSGIIAYVVAHSPLGQIVHGPLRMVFMFAPLAFIMFFSFRIEKMSVGAANFTYWAFSAFMGASLSYVFMFFKLGTIFTAFLATAVAFLSMSLYGYTTKKSLAGWGTFLFMGVIGILVVGVLNIFFFKSGPLAMAVSAVAVLVFAGLTAYDTQRLKNEYLYMSQAGVQATEYLAKGAIMGALSLYLNFVNMFTSLLHLIGMGEE